MLQNAYLLAKIGADTAENERNCADNLPKIGSYPTTDYPTERAARGEEAYGEAGFPAWGIPKNAQMPNPMRSGTLAKVAKLQNLQHLQNICWVFTKMLIFQTDFILKIWDCSGAKVCKLCRAWKMLSNAYFLAKFRFDTAENEPAKNLQNLI